MNVPHHDTHSLKCVSFRGDAAKAIWQGRRDKAVSAELAKAAIRKLAYLDAARILSDLRVPPANRPESLKGNRKGQYSIWVNDQFRICFMEMSVYALAKATGVNRTRINEIVRGQRAITADTALRLARYFGTTPELWLNLQTRYDLTQAEEALADTLAAIEPRAA